MDLTCGSYIGDFVSADDIEDCIGDDVINDMHKNRSSILEKIEKYIANDMGNNKLPEGNIDIILVAKVVKFHDSVASSVVPKPSPSSSGARQVNKTKIEPVIEEEKTMKKKITSARKKNKTKEALVGEAQLKSMIAMEEELQQQQQSSSNPTVVAKSEHVHTDEEGCGPVVCSSLPCLPPHAENTNLIDWSHADSQFGLSHFTLGIYGSRIIVSSSPIPNKDESTTMHLIENDIMCTSDRAHLEAYIDILKKTLCHRSGTVTIHTSHARLQKTHKEIEEFATDAPWASPCSRAHVDLLQMAWILYRIRTKVLRLSRIVVTVHPASEVKPSKAKKPAASIVARDAIRHEMSVLALNLDEFASEQKSILMSKIQKDNHSDQSTLIAKPWPIVNASIC